MVYNHYLNGGCMHRFTCTLYTECENYSGLQAGYTILVLNACKMLH